MSYDRARAGLFCHWLKCQCWVLFTTLDATAEEEKESESGYIPLQ